ncbi:MAG: hypothetical protein JRN16_01595 [Nitrososphaerota archaeon]|nr:hypothetical protein [Nitrososphaerota archaeon]MDG6975113.1 hypothetical protein [Nitrososphaerota archaeon]MDG7009579.1 hypothetical protein [Nitrososphaerota archaeon]MDG7019339.1 hypothetical protein [Nitrososphaerota archaeon]MDG7027087.1 hypothetical protein [Nitrososphaerota archaeon]
MVSIQRAIQGSIIFATLFGVPFLVEVHPVLPAVVFDSVGFGWVLFVVDSALTFVRPRESYYLGVVLAAAALLATWSQPAHLSLIEGGDLVAAATIIIGTVTEVAIIGLTAYFLAAGKRKDPWAWPGKQED